VDEDSNGQGDDDFKNNSGGANGIEDTQCGFKIFKNSGAKKLFTKLSNLHNGFKKISGSSVKAGFDVELLLLARKMVTKLKKFR